MFYLKKFTEKFLKTTYIFVSISLNSACTTITIEFSQTCHSFSLQIGIAYFRVICSWHLFVTSFMDIFSWHLFVALLRFICSWQFSLHISNTCFWNNLFVINYCNICLWHLFVTYVCDMFRDMLVWHVFVTFFLTSLRDIFISHMFVAFARKICSWHLFVTFWCDMFSFIVWHHSYIVAIMILTWMSSIWILEIVVSTPELRDAGVEFVDNLMWNKTFQYHETRETQSNSTPANIIGT